MILKWFIDQAHSAGIRIHGLGFTSSKYLPYLKFDSVDSTTWLSGARYGQIYKFDNGSDAMLRSAKRDESQAS